MDQSALQAKAAFEALFQRMAPERHRYDVFRDFTVMAACSLHNGLHQDLAREAEYLEIIGRYKSEDQRAFPELLAHLVAMLEPEPRDMLGPLYMELEVASRHQGQFFTPPEISEAMARMIFADHLRVLEKQPFVTLQEPACGAGGMVLAVVKVLIQSGYDPARALWVQAIDVDRLAALMAYVQLSLWNVPAEIVVGNTLSLEVREVWHTPAHHLGLWSSRLRSKTPDATEEPNQEPRPVQSADQATKAEHAAEQAAKPPVQPTQLSFDL